MHHQEQLLQSGKIGSSWCNDLRFG